MWDEVPSITTVFPGGLTASDLQLLFFFQFCVHEFMKALHTMYQGTQLVSFLKRKKKRNQEAVVGRKDRKREELESQCLEIRRFPSKEGQA